MPIATLAIIGIVSLPKEKLDSFRYPPLVYTATFTFSKRQFDDAFHALDQVIAATAKSLPGYLGEESWENPATGLISNVYYWESMEALRALIDHPAHQAAKREQSRWLAGYQVVIAQVVGSYGDGRIDHPLAQGGAKDLQPRN